MSDFSDELIATRSDFLSTFGESVNYRKEGAPPRGITAVVRRQRPGEIEGVPHGSSDFLTVFVANHATIGISSDEIDIGGDEIELARRIGKSATRMRITGIILQDEGMMELELR